LRSVIATWSRAHLRSLAPRAEVVLAPLSLGHYLSAVLDGPPVAGLIGTGTWPPAAASIVRLYQACAEGVPTPCHL
jgi:hypothetical protein